MSRMRCFRSILSLVISVEIPSRFTVKGSMITYPPFGDRNLLWTALNIRKRELHVKGYRLFFLFSKNSPVMISIMDEIPARLSLYTYLQTNV
jgi:hypothetical protein